MLTTADTQLVCAPSHSGNQVGDASESKRTKKNHLVQPTVVTPIQPGISSPKCSSYSMQSGPQSMRPGSPDGCYTGHRHLVSDTYLLLEETLPLYPGIPVDLLAKRVREGKRSWKDIKLPWLEREHTNTNSMLP